MFDVPFSLGLALLALVPMALVEVVKAVRWWILLGPGRLGFGLCLHALLAGQVTNQLAPLRAGEAVRLGLLKARGGRLITGAASVAGAKALDALCLAAVALFVGGNTIAQMRSSLAAVGGIVLLSAAGMLVGWRLRHRLGRSRWADRLGLLAVLELGRALRTPSVWVTVGLTTAVVWVAGLLANGLVLAAVGIPPSLDLAARMLLAGYLSGQVPAPPARLGVFEAAMVMALATGGISLPPALAAGSLLHACVLVELVLLLGVSVLLDWRRTVFGASVAPAPGRTGNLT